VLHQFLTANREELIRRCRSKVSNRASPPVTSSELEYGVPLFLEQLVEALRGEQANSAAGHTVIYGHWNTTPDAVESSRTAALHGEELLARGYTVDQVVHGYGDVCQAITELASERHVPLTLDEFRTLSRLLDNAMADAVAAFGRHRELVKAWGARAVRERVAARTQEQRRLLDAALRAFDAHDLGDISLTGATQSVLEDSLRKLRALQELPLAQRLPAA
jgi:hypothetical protein